MKYNTEKGPSKSTGTGPVVALVSMLVSGSVPLADECSIDIDAEDAAIALDISAAVGDGSETITAITVSGLPAGAVLSDGTNSFTASAAATSVDVGSWNLSSLVAHPVPWTQVCLTRRA